MWEVKVNKLPQAIYRVQTQHLLLFVRSICLPQLIYLYYWFGDNPVKLRRSNRLQNLPTPLSPTVILSNSRVTHNSLSQANAPHLTFSPQQYIDQEVQAPSSPPPTAQPTSPFRSFPLFPTPSVRSTASIGSPLNISFTPTLTPSYESSPQRNSSTQSDHLSTQTITTMNSEDMGSEREQRQNDLLRFLHDEGYSMTEAHRLAQDILRRNNRQ